MNWKIIRNTPKRNTMSFNAPSGLRNPHLQTILSSVGPRRILIRRRFKPYAERSREVILNCDDGVRLCGHYNIAALPSDRARQSVPEVKSDKLVILIHGWEGSHDSSYMLSMATRLLEAGVDVFRLNLRDHGDTHHLNHEIFNSTMVDEVISAIADLQARFEYPEYVLGGFSLGGNFCCRVAAMAHDIPAVALSRVVAFCPVLHAEQSNTVLNAPRNKVYGQYFVRKWKRSLHKKLQHFPDIGYHDELKQMKTLDDMNQQLVPKYTPYESASQYFNAYAITGDKMASTVCPVYLHFSRDDMMIPHKDIDKLATNKDLHITITENGGHCGFLMNWRLDSWQDQRMLELIGV